MLAKTSVRISLICLYSIYIKMINLIALQPEENGSIQTTTKTQLLITVLHNTYQMQTSQHTDKHIHQV